MTFDPSQIDAHDWSRLEDAYGAATDFPRDLQRAVGSDKETSRVYLKHLWGSVWHQGTVYTATPVAVPFLASVVGDSAFPDATRANIAMLLSEIADPSTFALPGETGHHRVEWMRLPTDPIPSRDLATECRDAVASVASILLSTIEHLGPLLHAGLVAMSAAVVSTLDSDAVRALDEMPPHSDSRVRLASSIVVALSGKRRSEVERLLRPIREDEGVRWHLSNFEGFVLPFERRAIETAKFLCADYADRSIWFGD